MKLVNVTGKAVTFSNPDLELTTIPPVWGVAARTSESSRAVGVFRSEGLELPVKIGRVDEPIDVPEPEEGTLFIVPPDVQAALPNRADLVSPMGPRRDDSGNVVSYSALRLTPAGGRMWRETAILTLEEFKRQVLASHAHVVWVGEFKETTPGNYEGRLIAETPGKGQKPHTYFGHKSGSIQHAFVDWGGDGFSEALKR